MRGSSYYFMRLLGLPETRKLEAQTVTKLAQFPWRLHGHDAAAASQAAFLRPALDDILREETYFEMRQAPGQPAEFVLAIRLSEKAAGVWYTNLAGAVQSLTGMAPISSVENPQAWSLRQPRSPGLLELTRVGEWTIVGAAESQNTLFAETVSRIRQEQRPAPPLKQWLLADIDLPRLSRGVGLEEPAFQGLPQVSLTVTGDGARVLTTGRMTFSEPLQIAAEPWTVPASFIHEPLTSLTASRGLGDWLATFSWWKELQLGEAPGQMFFWAREGGSFQTFLAAPLSDAVGRVERLSDRLINNGNPWMAQRGYVGCRRFPDGNGVMWGDMPDFRPFLRAEREGADSFIVAGLVAESGSPMATPLQSAHLQPILTLTNLVYYDWEETSARAEPWLFISQNARVISRRAQLPMGSAAASWLGSIIPRLDASETAVTQTGPNELKLSRKSTTGFTAPEMHLLVDWLESPLFPRGLYSLLVSPQPPPAASRP